MSSPRAKVCGITRAEDGRLAVSLGASYLGFILYEKSPRGIDVETFQSMHKRMPDSFRVMVDVRPDIELLKQRIDAGFDYFQIHFSEVHDTGYLGELSQLVAHSKLWLAPKLPPDSLFPESLFEYADTFLIDTYQKDGYGGSGKTGDWTHFKQLKDDYPEKTWILAGGLSPENIKNAIAEAQPQIVDVSSGLESSPGIKSAEKLKSFFANMQS
jgi:phosphoribosylanthranilate isomerase